MGDIIKDRLSLIISLIIGTGSGWGMTDFIEAPEIKKRLIAIAIAVSLLSSLLISFYLKRKAAKERSKPARRIITFATIIFILFTFSFFFTSDKLTISWKVENNKMQIVDTVIMVKGLYYATPAKKYIAEQVTKSHFRPGDDQILESFDYQTDFVWDKTSITLSRLLILFLYITMMGGFISGITALTEILAPQKPDNKPVPDKK